MRRSIMFKILPVILAFMKMVVTGKKSGGVVGMNTVGVKVLVKKTGGDIV
jgi:hypothetical protein